MRNLAFLLAVLLIITVVLSCTKKPVVKPAEEKNPIEDKWMIKKDSITLTDGGTSYVGGSADYFDFNSNKLYIKEGDKMETLIYHLTSDNVMLIGKVGDDAYGSYPYTGHIQAISVTSATLSITPISGKPDGYTSRLVVLSR